jgi:hypothetical protein
MSAPEVWQSSLRPELPTSITAEPVSAGAGSGNSDLGRRSAHLAGAERSTINDGALQTKRSWYRYRRAEHSGQLTRAAWL